MGSSNGTARVAGIVGIVLLVVGAIGWVMQLSGGLIAGSGMTNIFLWGLMIAMFAFMVGFGAGSQIVASIIFLSGKEYLRPIGRIVAACGLACVAAAGVAILADLGAARNIMAMIFGLNMRSPLAWDMIAMTAFIVLSAVQLIMIARDAKSVKIWAGLAGVAAVVLQIVEGLLFSTQTSHSWWATPIMPIDFLVVAIVSGSALAVVISCATGQKSDVISWLAKLCAITIAIHLVLALADLALVAAEGTPQAGGVLAALQANLWLYVCELGLPAVAMVLLFICARTGKTSMAAPAAIITMVGIFAHRMMLLYPAYNAPSLYLTLSGTNDVTGPYPISTGRYLDWDAAFALGTPYVPATAEWMAALLPLGFAIVAAIVVLWVMKKLSARNEAA